MSLRYRYNEQTVPPAPFVHVTLRCHETNREIVDTPALIDTAADRTVIPAKSVEQLNLVILDELPVSGFGGQVMVLPTFRVELGIRDLPAKFVEVFAHPDESHVLLGREVLNRCRIVLDGPQLTMEIE